LLIIFIFIFGLSIGSFLNAVIYRLKAKKSVWRGRSFCPKCKKPLGFWDLIPILSFIFLRGRCRQCHQKISWQYPLVELATGLIFILVFYYFSLFTFSPRFGEAGHLSLFTVISLLFYLFISSVLIVIFVYDLKHYLIPDKVIWPAIIVSSLYWLVGLILYFTNNKEAFFKLYPGLSNYYLVPNPFLTLLGVLLGGGFFLLVVLISRGRWMGGGDIKLGTFMGFVLGFPQIILALFIGFISGSLVGLSLIALKKKTMKSQIPFGPFLVFGTFIALFWGNYILNWYFNILIK
jgi:prepilin signal peptidase PulO-like enzyme (type II secretory pathway)